MTRAWASRFGAWALMFAAALGLGTLIPPNQSPDEHSHLMRAYLISKGELTLSTPSGVSSGGMVDVAIVYFVDAYTGVARSAQSRLSPIQRTQVELLRWGAPDIFYEVPGTGYYMPLIYAPHAAALLAGRTLGMTVADTYRLVRVATLLSCFGLLAAAWRILRPPALAIALLLLPMTLFQLLSPTLDGITTCLAVLALSLFFDGVLRQERWPPARSWLLGACVTLLATTRIQLLPLLALPLFIGWTRRSQRDTVLGIAAVLLSLAWVLFALANTVDLRVQRTESTSQLLLHYAAHPLAFLRVVGASVANPDLAYAYRATFIGVLGWLDTWLPQWAYPALWSALGLCAIASVWGAKLRQAPAARFLVVIAAIGCALLVFLALLVTWTPHPAATVMGVQGRYFVVPAIMLAYAIGATAAARRPQWPGRVLVGATAATSMYALLVTLLARYH